VGAAKRLSIGAYGVPTRYRVVVLTVSKHGTYSEETAAMKSIEVSHPEGGRMLVHVR
jgi:hypothetical protein